MAVVGSAEFTIGFDRGSIERAISGLENRFQQLDDFRIGISINQNIQRELQGINAATRGLDDLQIGVDISQAARDVQRLSNTFESVEAAVDALNRRRIDIEIETRSANSRLATLENQIRGIESRRILIEANTRTASARIEDIDNQLERLQQQRLDIRIDDADANAKLTRLDAQIERLQTQRIRLNLSVENAEPQLNALDARLATLEDKRVNLRLNAGNAERELNEINDQINELEGSNGDDALRRLNAQLQQLDRTGSTITPEVDTRNVRAASPILTGIFQGIGQEITQILANAISQGIRTISEIPVQSVGLFAGLESELVQFEARARGSVSSSEELARVSAMVADEAERIGIETSKTPEEVARIATRMVELGATAEDAARNVSGVVAALEATGFTDVDRTAQAIQAASNIFGESADSLADRIALLSSSTAVTSATDLEQAFGRAGGQFEATGQSSNALLAIFAKFRETSTPETAATATRNALQKLIPSTADAQAALNDLGVSLFDNSGQALPIIDVLGQLETSLNGLTQQQQSELLLDVFGSRSASQIQLLLGGLEDVRGTFNALENDAEGFATQSQEALNRGITAAVVRLQGTLQTLGSNFGEALAGGEIEGAIRGITSAFNEVIATEGIFDGISASVERLGAAFSGSISLEDVTSAFVSAAEGIDSAISGLINRFAEFVENTDSTDNLFANIGSIAGIITKIADLFVQASFATAEFFETFGINDTVSAALGGINTVLGAIADRDFSIITDSIQEFREGLEDTPGIIGAVVTAFNSINDATIAVAGVIGDTIIPVIERFVKNALVIPSAIGGGVSAVAGFLNDIFDPIQRVIDGLNQISVVADNIVGSVGGAVEITASVTPGDDGALDAINQGIANVQDAAQARVDLQQAANEQELTDLVQLESEKAEARQAALSQFQADSTTAIQGINSALAEELRGISELELGGADVNQLAVARVEAEQQATDAIIAELERQQAALADAVAAGSIDAEAAASERVRIEQELSSALDTEVQGRIDRQNALIAQQVSGIQSQFAELQSGLSFEQETINLEIGGLDDRLDLLNAEQGLIDAQIAGAEQLAQIELDRAQALGDSVGVREALANLSASERAGLEANARFDAQSLALKQEQRRLDLEASSLQAELNRLKAEEALLIAQAENADQSRLSILERQLDIARQQEQFAGNRAANTERIDAFEQATQVQEFDNLSVALEQSQRERLAGIDEVAAREGELVQSQIDGIGRVAEARAQALSGLFGAISQQSNTSQEDSLANIDAAQDRLSTARRAGFFQGAEGRTGANETANALRQVERLIAGGASDDRLARAAFNNQDNQAFAEALQVAGRGDIASLIDAETGFTEVSTAIQEVGIGIQEGLAEINASILETAGIEDMNPETNDPGNNLMDIPTAVESGLESGLDEGLARIDETIAGLSDVDIAALSPQDFSIPEMTMTPITLDLAPVETILRDLLSATENRPIQAGGNTYNITTERAASEVAQEIAMDQIKQVARGL